LATPQGLDGTRVAVEGAGVFEAQPGAGKEWRPIADLDLASQMESAAAQRQAFSRAIGGGITAVASSGDTVYAGASDGRIWLSADRGQTWRPSRQAAGSPVTNFFVDAQQPQVALAALGGKGAHVLRTVNTGVTWDDLTANLPDVP